MYRKILIATDLSSTSIQTARKAVEIAKFYKADISILHVIESNPKYDYSYIRYDVNDDYLETAALNNLRTFCNEFNIVAERQHICIGCPRNRIIEHAHELAADLIVVGSHGVKGFAKFLGTTATSVLRNAKCDVLTVPTQ